MQWFLYLSYIIASFSFYIPTTVEVMKTQQKKHKIKKKIPWNSKKHILNFIYSKFSEEKI